MLKYFSPPKNSRSRGEATINVILAIILISGVFLTGGILPHMEDDTLKKDAEAVVQGIRSEDDSGTSFIASSGTTNDSKRTLQMKQLILVTATPSPDPTQDRLPTTLPEEWKIVARITKCEWSVDGRAARGNIAAVGTSRGYIQIKVGADTIIYQSAFIPPRVDAPIFLPNSKGFNTQAWKVELYSGGSLSGSTYSNGIIKSSTTKGQTAC